MRGATASIPGAVVQVAISIHAPHAGCDGCADGRSARGDYFNPRTPCGVRLTLLALPAAVLPFQSTHPMRGATGGHGSSWNAQLISIHAPHAGCDALLAVLHKFDVNISIHAPHAGCDQVFHPSVSRR